MRSSSFDWVFLEDDDRIQSTKALCFRQRTGQWLRPETQQLSYCMSLYIKYLDPWSKMLFQEHRRGVRIGKEVSTTYLKMCRCIHYSESVSEAEVTDAGRDGEIRTEDLRDTTERLIHYPDLLQCRQNYSSTLPPIAQSLWVTAAPNWRDCTSWHALTSILHNTIHL
jgi:hypothetical protein